MTGLPPGALSKLINGITEAKDLGEAVYDALPEKLRKQLIKENGGRSLTFPKKMAALYKHINEVDVGDALENIAKNQLEDFVFGKAGQGMARAQNTRARLGLSTNTKSGGVGPL